MTTLREAALMALEALEDSCYPRASTKHSTRYDDAIDVLRKALDADSMASLPEPVAWCTFDGEGGYEFRYYQDNEEYQQRFIERNGEQYASWVAPLYTAPPLSMTISGDCATSRSSNRREWQGLTHEERDEICKDFVGDDDRVGAYRSLALEVEVRLTERNK